MTHELPELPYAETALEPHISAETLQYHHGKHHATYVSNLNELLSGTELELRPLEEIIQLASGKLFNNAAQVWNHTFYWNCLSPKGGGQPEGPLAAVLEQKFVSFDQFKQHLRRMGTRVLHRLPQCPAKVPGRFLEPCELAVRCPAIPRGRAGLRRRGRRASCSSA